MLQKTFRAAIARLVYKYQRTVSEVRQQILFLLNRLRAADDPAGVATLTVSADGKERVPGFLATCQVCCRRGGPSIASTSSKKRNP